MYVQHNSHNPNCAMFNSIREFIEDLQIEWEEFSYKGSREYREFVHNRVTAHQLAMKEGRNSPYTHPEEYTDNFTPLKKLKLYTP